MNFAQELVASNIFQFFTWFTIGSALGFNGLATWTTYKDKRFGARPFHIFWPITFMSAFWFVAYGLHFINHISREQYLNLVSPIVPVTFIVVWVLPPLSYWLEVRERKKVR